MKLVLGRVLILSLAILFGISGCATEEGSSSTNTVAEDEGGTDSPDGAVEDGGESDKDIVESEGDGEATTDTTEEEGDTDQELDGSDTTAGPTSGPCEFWVQNCGGGTNCYPNGANYECFEPTGTGEEADACEEDTDCAIAGLLCSPDGCAIACSINELVGGDAPICVDNCQFGFEVIDLDLQLGYCLPDTTPGAWEQVQPETVKKEHVFKSIWMSDSNDIHLVGADGIAVHYQGDYWEILTEGFWPNLNGVWGFAPDDVWAVGIAGTIVHYDGVKWAEPGGCTGPADCDDGDECTIDTCEANGGCSYASTGAEGCCGTVTYSVGWDSGTLEGWTVTETFGDPFATWQAFSHEGSFDGQPRYTSPFTSLYFGNSTVLCAGSLTDICPNYAGSGSNAGGITGGTALSPVVSLPANPGISLSFELWIDTEAGTSYDTLSLHLVTDSGLDVLLWEKFDTHNSFETIQVPLAAYGGSDVQFRFDFSTQDSIANETEGVYIDDFTIDDPCKEGTGGPQELEFPTLFDIWGPAPDDIYAVGLNGFVAHYDGQLWSEVDFSDSVGPWNFKGLYGFTDSLHLVGDGGLIMAEAAGQLASQNSGSNSNLLNIWGNSPSDLYAVGEGGALLHNSGSGWITEPVGVIADLSAVWGAGSFEVVAVGATGTIIRKSEGTWTTETSATSFDLNDVWGVGSKNTWAVGESGTILHYEGAGWLPDLSPSLKNLNAVHGSSAEDIWAVGLGGIILHNDSTGWSDVSSVVTQEWFDVWASGDGSAIVVGDLGLIIQGDGETWSEMSHPMGEAPIEAIWGRSADDVYAAGEGFIIHYDGNEERKWSLHASTIQLATWRGVCGSGADNVMVVGSQGTIIRWNGSSWGKVPVEPKTEATAEAPAEYYTEQLHGCWTLDSDTAWAVGEAGIILELIDGEFKKAENLIPVSLRDVFAFSKDLVFAVGIEGVILSSRGIESSWLPIYSGTVAGLFGILGTSLEDITAVGDLGTIQRFIPFYDALGTSPPTVVEEVEEVEESGEGEDEETEEATP